jgi:uncharacterized Zn-binding protein involved in type VI secretion
MGLPAARVTDSHVCPVTSPVPHVATPFALGSPDVLINGLGALRMGDFALCGGAPAVIVSGSPEVLINKMPAATLTASTSHGGVVVTASADVLL